MSCPVVEAENLAVSWTQSPILSGINLRIEPGERVALVGANGCGKSTLLRALCGLLPPLDGRILWMGSPLPGGPARVTILGALLQNEPVAPYSLGQLVGMGLALDGPATARSRRQVERALAAAQLTELRDRPCSALSGGEYQRARLARALVAGPRLLVLDEPTNHLDPARQAQFLNHLNLANRNAAVVVATHDLQLASLCDRVALLHAGRMHALGAPEQVLREDKLAPTMGLRVRRVEDPSGGPPLFRWLLDPPKERAA